MSEFIEKLLSSGSFIPHGHCYLWQSELVWFHILSDSLIALAYFSIPMTLVYFVQKREDLPFDWIFLLFSAFIVTCGTTHLMEVWTLWHPTYWLSGTVKALTALISLYTAFTLVQLMPQALTIPSPAQLSAINLNLQQQIRDRQQAEAQVHQLNQDLEAKVAQRTAELKNSMAQVRDYVERMALAMDAAKMGSWDWDLETPKITWSQYHEVLWGYEPGNPERSYEDWKRRIHPDDVVRAETAIDNARITHSDFCEEYRVVWDDSTVHWVAGYGRFYFRNEDQPFRMMGMVQNITDRKLAEVALQEQAQELNQINTQLRQTTALLSQRNQELDQFARIVSHDLKAPLRAISNLSQWIEEDLADQLPSDIQHNLNLLRTRVFRMEALINGLLTYARIGYQEVPTMDFSLNELLSEIVDSLNIPPKFTIQLPKISLTLTTNRLLLSQVLTNLISNAIKHHPHSEGEVRITAEILTQNYEFSVYDNGSGIAPEHHNRIFDIFQTLNNQDQKESTGIGLAIIKKILERVGGEIYLESELGQGTTFYFTWPIV